MKKIKIVEVKSEIGAGTRGSALGIDALKIACLDKGSNFFANYSILEVETNNMALFDEPQDPTALRLEAIQHVLKDISCAVFNTFKEGDFPLVLAGDHSNAAGTISGIKRAFPKKRLGIIWIDAHGDLHTPYTSPSGNVHGMPLAIAAAEDNLDMAINTPSEQTLNTWNRLKNLGVEGPKFEYQDLVFIALRDTEEPEEALLKRHGIKNFTTQEVRTKGGKAIAKASLDHLADCDMIYISFDVDSLDANLSRGTGTPVANGLTFEEALDINAELLKDPRVVCWEMVEVNPTLDSENKMAELAFDILEASTEVLENTRLKKEMA
ncbi:MAG: arginase [Cyclobacteriaceae bacterium]|nr:arginase [Cyclobacteriaceae bacterium]MCH8516104.1 arginase [Cyclobacteriaceae bacterium]